MSKAEDLALEKYPRRSVLVVPARGGGYYADKHLRDGYIEGYQQAEKDLKLTWENMFDIFRLVNVVLDDYAEGKTRKEIGEEVLKRFKERAKK